MLIVFFLLMMDSCNFLYSSGRDNPSKPVFFKDVNGKMTTLYLPSERVGSEFLEEEYRAAEAFQDSSYVVKIIHAGNQLNKEGTSWFNYVPLLMHVIIYRKWRSIISAPNNFLNGRPVTINLCNQHSVKNLKSTIVESIKEEYAISVPLSAVSVIANDEYTLADTDTVPFRGSLDSYKITIKDITFSDANSSYMNNQFQLRSVQKNPLLTWKWSRENKRIMIILENVPPIKLDATFLMPLINLHKLELRNADIVIKQTQENALTVAVNTYSQLEKKLTIEQRFLVIENSDNDQTYQEFLYFLNLEPLHIYTEFKDFNDKDAQRLYELAKQIIALWAHKLDQNFLLIVDGKLINQGSTLFSTTENRSSQLQSEQGAFATGQLFQSQLKEKSNKKSAPFPVQKSTWSVWWQWSKKKFFNTLNYVSPKNFLMNLWRQGTLMKSILFGPYSSTF